MRRDESSASLKAMTRRLFTWKHRGVECTRAITFRSLHYGYYSRCASRWTVISLLCVFLFILPLILSLSLSVYFHLRNIDESRSLISPVRRRPLALARLW